MKNYVTLTCIGVSLLMGCQKTPETLVETETLLDQQLAEALGEGASRKGASSFLLPNSGDLSAIPQDLNNPLSEEKVALGKLLYHETGLAIKYKYLEGMRTYSSASCLHAQAGIRQGIADGVVGF